jgi:hypothetical protein
MPRRRGRIVDRVAAGIEQLPVLVGDPKIVVRELEAMADQVVGRSAVPLGAGSRPAAGKSVRTAGRGRRRQAQCQQHDERLMPDPVRGWPHHDAGAARLKRR